MNEEQAIELWDNVYSWSINALVDTTDKDLIGTLSPFMVTTDTGEGLSWTMIRDMRTVHMGSGRQSYKSAWIKTMLRRYPESIVIVRDKAAREALLAQRSHDDYNPGVLKSSVFTVTDLLTAVEHNTKRIRERLRTSTHVFIDDASRNYKLADDRFKSTISGLLKDDVIVVMMG
ncbi:hypothetical protein D3C85_769980 [compost metagenome]